jgi:hypothetical protein
MPSFSLPALPSLPPLDPARRAGLSLFEGWGEPALPQVAVTLAVLEGRLDVDVSAQKAFLSLTDSTQPGHAAEAIRALKQGQEVLLKRAWRDSADVEELLDAVDRQTLSELIAQWDRDSAQTLLERLAGPVLHGQDAAQVRSYPMTCLARLAESPLAQSLGQDALAALHWYGEHPEQEDSPLIRAKLIAAILALSLDTARRDFDLLDPRWVGHDYPRLGLALEQHLLDSAAALSETSAALAAFVLKTKLPADFSVLDVPPDLSYRSSTRWVAFKHAVDLAEAIDPGSAQRMTYAQLLDYPARLLASQDEDHPSQVAAALLVPLMSWAQATGQVDYEPGTRQFSASAVEKATDAFARADEQLLQANQALGVPMPMRLEMADEALKALGVSPQTPFINRSGRRVSTARELAAMGYLQDPDWEPGSVQGHDDQWYPVWTSDAYRQCPDIPRTFAAAYEPWVKNLKAAYALIVQALILQLPRADREGFEQGTVRAFSAARLPHGRWERYSYTAPSAAEIGHFGALLQVSWAGNTRYYQLFPHAHYLSRVDHLVFEPGGRLLESYDPEYRNDIRHYPQVNAGKIPEHAMRYRRASLVPLDFSAFSSGAAPRTGVSSEVIMQAIGGFEPVETVDPAQRIEHLAKGLAHHFFYRSDQELALIARGQTAFEGPAPVREFFKQVVPFWGSVEDLHAATENGRPANVVLAALGIVADALTVIVPVFRTGYWLGRSVQVGARAGLRASLPALFKSIRVLVKASLEELVGAIDVLALGRGLGQAGRSGLLQLREVSQARRRRKNLGQCSGWQLNPAQAKLWRDKKAAGQTGTQQLRKVGQMPEVLVHKAPQGRHRQPWHYLIDPRTTQPYGPPLARADDHGTLALRGPAVLRGESTDGGWYFVDPAPDLTKHWIYQGDEVYLQSGSIHYRLERRPNGSAQLRRDPGRGTTPRLVPGSCRLPRALGFPTTGNCDPNTAVDPDFSATQVSMTVDNRDSVPWFTDLSVTLDPVSHKLFHNGRAWKKNRQGKLVPAEGTRSGRYHPRLDVEVLGGNQLFKQLRIDGGIVEGIADSRRVSAVVAQRKDGQGKVMVTRTDDNVFYKGEYTDTFPQRLTRFTVSLNQVPPRAPTPDEYLALIYLGAYDANGYLRKVSPQVVQADLQQIRQDILAGKTAREISQLLGSDNPYDLNTDPAQAVLFCKYMQGNVVIHARRQSDAWNRLTLETSEITRERIARQLNTLLQQDVFDAVSLTRADLMRRVTHQPKNLAYARIRFKQAGRPDTVYYGLSGVRYRYRVLPLAKFAEQPEAGEYAHLRKAGWAARDGAAIAPEDGTRYINSQPRVAPWIDDDPASRNVLFLPDLAAPRVGPVGNTRMLDTERGILVRMKKDRIEPEDIASMEVFTVLPTCQSCTVSLRTFGARLARGTFVVHEGL